MKKAMISELKNRLSHYLRFVRRGESVLVYDRTRPIARIDPVRQLTGSEADDGVVALERSGVLRAPTAPLPADWLRSRIRSEADVITALLEERASGR